MSFPLCVYMRTMLICGKALTSLQTPFFLNNYSLEKQSSSPQEARPTFPLVFISFPSPTDMITFLAHFLVVLVREINTLGSFLE